MRGIEMRIAKTFFRWGQGYSNVKTSGIYLHMEKFKVQNGNDRYFDTPSCYLSIHPPNKTHTNWKIHFNTSQGGRVHVWKRQNDKFHFKEENALNQDCDYYCFWQTMHICAYLIYDDELERKADDMLNARGF